MTLFSVVPIFRHIHHLCDTDPLFSDTCLLSSAVLGRNVIQPPRGNPPSVAVQLSHAVLPHLRVVGHNLAVRRRRHVRILTQALYAV